MARAKRNGVEFVKPFKAGQSLETSQWYMGMLTTYLADAQTTRGLFTLVDATVRSGSEPPPHVHSREDELFYVLEGEFDVYVGNQTFTVQSGECIFLPRMKPHAWVIRSARLRMLTLFTPGGVEGAFRAAASPARYLNLPTGALTYATGDSKDTEQRFNAYGIRLLTRDEIAEQLPLYPK